MGLSTEEIRKILIDKIHSEEPLGVHDLKSLADQSDELNAIQLNEMYSTLLQSPSISS